MNFSQLYIQLTLHVPHLSICFLPTNYNYMTLMRFIPVMKPVSGGWEGGGPSAVGLLMLAGSLLP